MMMFEAGKPKCSLMNFSMRKQKKINQILGLRLERAFSAETFHMRFREVYNYFGFTQNINTLLIQIDNSDERALAL
jgi:hypothetical protein